MEHDSHPLVQANRNPVRLRGFVRDDLPAIYALDQICFRKGISYSLAEFELLTTHASSFCLIAETAEKRLAGFAVTERTRRGGGISGHIITIDVDPACRRRGIGRLLMLALEEELAKRGARRCVLEVATDDPGAQEFYSGLGYQTTARLRGYYMGSLDAMVMEKKMTVAKTETL